nr:MAG TPA: CsbD-like protein [Caudoviricetes sp.]
MGDIENKKDNLVGKAKEAYGEATDNDKVANEGKGEQATSEAKDKLHDAGEHIKEGFNKFIGDLKK